MTELTGKKSYITKDEIEALKILKSENHFVTRFNILAGHNGWRNRCIHTIMGVSHGGKSTLTRTLIMDLLKSNSKKRVGYWASEESFSDFVTELSLCIQDADILKKLFVFSEIGDLKKGANQKEVVERFIETNNLEILFIDNITTSRNYEGATVSAQSDLIMFYKSLAEKYGIPIVLVAHTGANVTENFSGIIEMNHIRGGKAVVNLSNFFYIMQSFYIGSTRINTLRITKHRGYNLSETMFNLQYSAKHKIFGGDVAISFKEFKKNYKDRNKL